MSDDSLSRGLESYRAAAATAFFLTRSSSPSPSSPASAANEAQGERATVRMYKRALFPELEQFLSQAAEKYTSHKISVATVNESAAGGASTEKLAGGTAARALGSSGQLVTAIGADVRRQRWLEFLSEVRHRRFVAPAGSSLSPSPAGFGRRLGVLGTMLSSCGIPKDVRERYARLFTAVRHVIGGNCSSCSSSSSSSLSSSIRPPPCMEHANRCRASLARGARTLLCRAREQAAVADCADAVRARYAGKPDEIYRRKTSKKFAAWRRRAREQSTASQCRVRHAEQAMRTSRGYDQLLTQRSYGDTSFAPFLFQTESHAFAYSSRISDAPKLRKVMVDKYSQTGGIVLDDKMKLTKTEKETDSVQKAHVAAQTYPLFHTRVMNRFE